ncbi:MAG: DUF433 domain-containing protein [Myxococcales bacterium]|nr:DUF433 domain-containing protein [Myxococcales bacterium]
MTDVLTTAEVAAFTGLDERAVRKDVEHGIFGSASPPRFGFAAVVYFRALSLLGLHLGTQDRRRIYQLIADALAAKKSTVEIGTVAEIRLAPLRKEIEERLAQFATWKRKLVTSDEILGGEPVFPKSRLAVRHVGGMLLRGASPEEIREDYPYVTEQDSEFARLYALAYPRVGRPRGEAG